MKQLSFRQLIRGKKLVAAVVPHTHWDRAWYHPFEHFRLSLCRVLGRLLDILENDPRYTQFTFDGQTVVLEDYLELFPDDRPRIERLVRQGRLTVGPFYVLPDVFLITGESLIRNGVIGQEIAESFGRSSRQGYVADPFGLVSQIPQIWQGLGLESIFFSRGMSKEQMKRAGSTFWWQGPDGRSRLLAIFQVEGYANMMNWGVPTRDYPRGDPDTDEIDHAFAEQQVREVLDAYARVGNRSRVLFFGNGNDHHGPAHKLPDLVAHSAKRFPDVSFVQIDTDRFVALVKQERPRLRTLSGEMHTGDFWSTLNGTLDSRPYLKQQYDQAASRLERNAEPLTALVASLGLEGRQIREQHHTGFAFNVGNCSALPPAVAPPALRYAWKTLLRNSPHDDICGCSVDATHEDAENRAKRVDEIADLLTSDAALRIARSARRPRGQHVAQLLVWNPLPHRRKCPVNHTMQLPANGTDLKLVDERGRELPASIKARSVGRHYRRWNSDYFEELPQKAIKATVTFTPDLPPLGYRTFYLQEGESPAARASVKRLPSGMKNEFVRVRLHTDGTFDLTDRRTGARYRGLNRLRDQADAGDLYVSRLLPDGIVTAARSHGRMRCVEALPDRVTWETRLTLPKVPVDLNASRTERSRKTAPLRITFRYTLYSHSPVVHIRATWENEHREHRLTVDFPTGFRTTLTEAGSIFDVIPHDAPCLQEACRDFVTTKHGRLRATLLSRGMHSYDAHLERGRLILTKCLLKANGYIHGPLRPFWAAPGGNCLRPISQEYAFLPGRAADSWATLSQEAAAFRHEPYIGHYLYSPGGGDLPGAHSFLRVSGPFELTAFKQCEEGNSLLVRLVNMSPKTAGATLRPSPLLGIKSAHLTDLRERRLKHLPIARGVVRVRARTREIVTIELAT